MFSGAVLLHSECRRWKLAFSNFLPEDLIMKAKDKIVEKPIKIANDNLASTIMWCLDWHVLTFPMLPCTTSMVSWSWQRAQRCGRPAGASLPVSSYLLQRAKHKGNSTQWDWGRETSVVSRSLSPLLCVLCGNICFLRCSFPSCSGRVLCVAPPQLHCSSQSLSLPSCSHDAPVMTRRHWWNWCLWRNESVLIMSLTPRETWQ